MRSVNYGNPDSGFLRLGWRPADHWLGACIQASYKLRTKQISIEWATSIVRSRCCTARWHMATLITPRRRFWAREKHFCGQMVLSNFLVHSWLHSWTFYAFFRRNFGNFEEKDFRNCTLRSYAIADNNSLSLDALNVIHGIEPALLRLKPEAWGNSTSFWRFPTLEGSELKRHFW